MIKEYNINDYLKEDKELQKAVIQELITENEKLKAIIKQAIKDFNHEIGTPYYDKLCENAIKLKIRGSIDE